MPSAPSVLVANPSFDVYGADLQMLESVRALLDAGSRVRVLGPTDGPLRPRLEALGAETEVLDYPVLRRGDMSPAGIARLGGAAAASLGRLRSAIRASRCDVVYVNTVTLPWWLTAARLARTPVLCHVHEAEPTVHPAVRTAISATLVQAGVVMVNSRITLETTCAPLPRLRPRARLVYNGVEGPPEEPAPARLERPVRLAAVGRLSPRKAPHVALEATALLRASGVDAVVEVAGTPVPGREDYLHELERRAGQADLAGAVTFAGYVSPVWPVLARSDVFVATSTAEPFGNAVVEAQLAGRPVVATAVEGHLETVEHGATGLHVPVGDPDALADAVRTLVDDPAAARRMARAARSRAVERFGVEQYADAVVATVAGLAR